MKKDNKLRKFILVGSIIMWVIQLMPPKSMPIEDTINYKLSGRVKKVIGTINGHWVHGFYIKLNNMDKPIKIYDYRKKRDSIFKNGYGNKNYTFFSNIVKKNDSVFKEKGSDSLFLYRNNKLIYKCRLIR